MVHIRYKKAAVSLTVDPDLIADLDMLVSQRRSSRSAIMREALILYLRVNSPHQPMPVQPVSTQPEAA